METNVVELLPGLKNILRDSRGNELAAFDFYDASASTNESVVHFFYANVVCLYI